MCLLGLNHTHAVMNMYMYICIYVYMYIDIHELYIIIYPPDIQHILLCVDKTKAILCHATFLFNESVLSGPQTFLKVLLDVGATIEFMSLGFS